MNGGRFVFLSNILFRFLTLLFENLINVTVIKNSNLNRNFTEIISEGYVEHGKGGQASRNV